jgi:hypothetical protein
MRDVDRNAGGRRDAVLRLTPTARNYQRVCRNALVRVLASLDSVGQRTLGSSRMRLSFLSDNGKEAVLGSGRRLTHARALSLTV